MVDPIPLSKEEFTACVHVAPGMSLLTWLQNLNRLASPDPLGRVDNSLSEGDFFALLRPGVFLSDDPTPSFLKQFQTFGDFRRWVYAYKKGQLCHEQCRKEIPPGASHDSFLQDDICFPIPPPPGLGTTPVALAKKGPLPAANAPPFPSDLRGKISPGFPQEGALPSGSTELSLFEIYRRHQEGRPENGRQGDGEMSFDLDVVSETLEAARSSSGSGLANGVDLVFVIDASGSMAIDPLFIVGQIQATVDRLTGEGAPFVRVGVVFFSDEGSIHIAVPMAEMDRATLETLPEKISRRLFFCGGIEPVGEATVTGLKLLRKSPAGRARALVIITDEDGLHDDKAYSLNVSRAQNRAKAWGIATRLFSRELHPTVLPAIARTHRRGETLGKKVTAPFRYQGPKADLVDVVRAANIGDDPKLRLRATEELFRRGERGEAIIAARRMASRSVLKDDSSWGEASVTAAMLLTREGDPAGKALLHHVALLGAFPAHRQRAAEELARLEPETVAGMGLAQSADLFSTVAGNFFAVNGVFSGLAQFAHVVSDSEGMERLVPLVQGAIRRIPDSGERLSFLEFSAEYARRHGLGKLLADAGTLFANRERGLRWGRHEPFLFQPDFAVNENAVHYFVNASREEGEARLRDLALESDREEAWIYADYESAGIRYNRWFEVGMISDKTSVLFSLSPIDELLGDPEAVIHSITPYHIHPLGGSAGKLTPGVLSPEDVGNSVQILTLLRLSGKVAGADCRVMTPFGRYSLTLQEIKKEGHEESREAYRTWLEQNKGEVLFEQDVLGGINTAGILEASYDSHYPLLVVLQDRFRPVIARMEVMDKPENSAWKRILLLAEFSREVRALENLVRKAGEGGVPPKLLDPYQAIADDLKRYERSVLGRAD